MTDEKDERIEKLHPSVRQVLQFFKYKHLTEELRDVSAKCAELANCMANSLPQNQELTVGLRKLLEAKDCFVRAALSGSTIGPSPKPKRTFPSLTAATMELSDGPSVVDGV